ncbi:hypothetical protein CONPUDRAFT_155161 [Coniophora puteana RWD-64-598 SS2]|uniref:Ribonuclease H1 N-terminal domain-containing protein n=1 Tax=Coniophora puteana (strain RWD-64-598) TaxID=741705 RepID=A0A5M3MLX3_CONPW|nr:uncharacterized protein CONPUDRAFT_155161 [Coniophora puteana RWD-64-598 SS2]EIW79764.1 hypothetical protein CONPUDRAFT_155161 [Coniophora puteana RWD-64-598 SS2]
MHIPAVPPTTFSASAFEAEQVDHLVSLIKGWAISDAMRQQLVFQLARANWSEVEVMTIPTEISDTEDGFDDGDDVVEADPSSKDVPSNAAGSSPSSAGTTTTSVTRLSVPPAEAPEAMAAVATTQASPSSTNVSSAGPPPVSTSTASGSGHHQMTYLGVSFWLPNEGVEGPFYLVTRGKHVGIFASWSKTSPFVTGVSGAIFHRVKELEGGMARLFDAAEDGQLVVIFISYTPLTNTVTMPAGRPRQYTTDEERQDAARASRARYYQKNKAVECEKRRAKYRDNTAALSEDLTNLEEEMLSILNGNPSLYMKDIRSKLAASKDKQEGDRVISELDETLESIFRAWTSPEQDMHLKTNWMIWAIYAEFDDRDEIPEDFAMSDEVKYWERFCVDWVERWPITPGSRFYLKRPQNSKLTTQEHQDRCMQYLARVIVMANSSKGYSAAKAATRKKGSGGKRGAPGWPTDEQKDWLKARLPQYTALIPKRNYESFWVTTNSDWFREFPEQVGEPGRPLSAEENLELGDAIKKRKDIQRWYRWHARAATANGRSMGHIASSIINGLLHPRTRLNKDWEIFSKLYYDKKIAYDVDAELASLPPDKTVRKVDIVAKHAKRLLGLEKDPAVHAEIASYKQAQEAAMGARKKCKKGLSLTAEEVSAFDLIDSAIMNISTAVREILTYCSGQTNGGLSKGWAFSAIMGGQDALNGVHVVGSVHVGWSPDGCDFGKVSTLWSEVHKEFVEFTKTAHGADRDDADAEGELVDEHDELIDPDHPPAKAIQLADVLSDKALHTLPAIHKAGSEPPTNVSDPQSTPQPQAAEALSQQSAPSAETQTVPLTLPTPSTSPDTTALPQPSTLPTTSSTVQRAHLLESPAAIGVTTSLAVSSPAATSPDLDTVAKVPVIASPAISAPLVPSPVVSVPVVASLDVPTSTGGNSAPVVPSPDVPMPTGASAHAVPVLPVVASPGLSTPAGERSMPAVSAPANVSAAAVAFTPAVASALDVPTLPAVPFPELSTPTGKDSAPAVSAPDVSVTAVPLTPAIASVPDVPTLLTVASSTGNPSDNALPSETPIWPQLADEDMQAVLSAPDPPTAAIPQTAIPPAKAPKEKPKPTAPKRPRDNSADADTDTSASPGKRTRSSTARDTNQAEVLGRGQRKRTEAKSKALRNAIGASSKPPATSDETAISTKKRRARKET